MTGAHSRRKGADGEREVARLIFDLLGVPMRRRLSQYQCGGFDLESADGDAMLSGHAIEVKRAQRATQATVARWWRQTCEQAGERKPVLWFRGDGEEWRIVCRLDVAGHRVEPMLTATDWAADESCDVTAAVYRAGTIKHERRTRARMDQLDRQILDVLAQDHPQSVRHVFYRMTDPRLPEPVEKSDRGYRHVQHRCVELRRSGRLPYGWISDASRRGYFTPTYRDASDFLRSMKGFYRADLWANSPVHVEVWAESRSIAGVIQDDCEELAVSLYPCGGFSSITFAHEAATMLNQTDGKRVVIFYIGDYDPAGVLIDEALERELRAHLADHVEMTFTRLGITEKQIAEYDLPTKPRKLTDRRSLHVKETVEAEAMPAADLRALLRASIEKWLSPDALRVAKVAEDSEREHIERMARLLGNVRKSI